MRGRRREISRIQRFHWRFWCIWEYKKTKTWRWTHNSPKIRRWIDTHKSKILFDGDEPKLCLVLPRYSCTIKPQLGLSPISQERRVVASRSSSGEHCRCGSVFFLERRVWSFVGCVFYKKLVRVTAEYEVGNRMV